MGCATYAVTSRFVSPTLLPGTIVPLVGERTRCGLSVFNDGTDAEDLIALYLGRSPSVGAHVCILQPFALWEPPDTAHPGDKLWAAWLTQNGGSVGITFGASALVVVEYLPGSP